MIPIPNSKPKGSLAKVCAAAERQWRAAGNASALPDFFVLAVRGYYRDSMGRVGSNDLNQYDDAFFIVSPLGFSAWNGNTDPTRYGWNPNADGYMARLAPGCYHFQSLIHRAKYAAFGQGPAAVKIERIKSDGTIAKTSTGCFGINLHRGGINGTSSEGCLTVPVEQWEKFHAILYDLMKRLPGEGVALVLTEGPIN
jgi:hypothetical protein